MPTPPAHSAELQAPQSAFVSGAGLILDEVGPHRVVGHINLGPDHHTPWGIVHGGVYATAVESAASLGASAAVVDQGLVAVGLTNTTHFLRPLTAGRVTVTAVALNQGRTQQLWQVDVNDQPGRLVAHGELRLQNVARNTGGAVALAEASTSDRINHPPEGDS
jgi:1,4-dihydroxy-2-naphthoyl-CoA hydrolase